MNSVAIGTEELGVMLPCAGQVEQLANRTFSDRRRAREVAELVRNGANPLFALARSLATGSERPWS